MSAEPPQKFTISKLPLPPTSHVLTHKLTPDNRVPTVDAFRKVLRNEKVPELEDKTGPSIQRRARLLDPPCHFAYVAPLPLGFPYEITPPENEEEIEDKGAWVEKWLADREAVNGTAAEPNGDANGAGHLGSRLRIYYPKNRDQPRELIGLSETGLRDCLPHLDVGDAFAVLGTPTLAHSFEDEEIQEGDEAQKNARQELIDIVSGHATLMSDENSDMNYAPWSLRYSGHQFGSWAGQLGDGRAISLLATPHPASPNQPDLSYELQLKGAGRTPFSRSADGLAVLRSSVREFLCSEAMHALRIPTTRSLSLVSLPALSVYRERVETASVLCRVAPSFLRIGSFEALNPPKVPPKMTSTANNLTGMFFFGGGQQKADYDALRILGEWVAKKVLFMDVKENEAWGKKMLLEIARRNARMVAGWQAYGFMHGVINTDNVSVLGLTIDYGPYAFMDVFDPFHICNHSDEEGRYSYQNQPSMILFAMRSLLNALAPLIGAEAELGKAVGPQWASEKSSDEIAAWAEKGVEDVQDELQQEFQQICAEEYGRLMHQRLGLKGQEPTDEAEIVRPLLDLIKNHKLDFHSVFRKLAYFRPSLLESSAHVDGEAAGSSSEPNTGATQSPLEKFLSAVLSQTPYELLDRAQAAKDVLTWLDKYAERLERDTAQWGEDADAKRQEAMLSVNPRFILRQWVLEEVIKKCEQDVDSGKRVLRKVLQMACSPYEKWGAEDQVELSDDVDKEVAEERRYCGMGERKMLGFQCSCSS
ncbi:UPF0061-domain-containing protein [Punctularia strigosozonata HHB-11173 SS5]|uniref:Selenoprotein O n=1 Tax=Punctularia strigosozonata (strain HHB-11173) TaxID=741275 RepID=R7S0X4_PUNST|nr:UPF0061-domain-containing protein [Punctularia strigosozonata HHB-11173 SS5]EIN04035.1 UPF0061-domain-containing protein [Punctularia strigosozonata HHB-11173 SS5]